MFRSNFYALCAPHAPTNEFIEEPTNGKKDAKSSSLEESPPRSSDRPTVDSYRRATLDAIKTLEMSSIPSWVQSNANKTDEVSRALRELGRLLCSSGGVVVRSW